MADDADAEAAIEKIKPVKLEEPSKLAPPLKKLCADPLYVEGHFHDVAFSTDGKLIAGAGSDRYGACVWLYDVSTGREVNHIAPEIESTEDIARVVFSPNDGGIAWAERGGFVAFWNVTNDRLEWRKQIHQGPVNDLAFSNKGDLLASAGSDGLVSVVNVSNPASKPRTFKTVEVSPDRRMARGELVGASSVVFATDATRLIGGTADGNIFIWNLGDGTLERKFTVVQTVVQEEAERPAHAKLNCLALTPDGGRFMTVARRVDAPVPKSRSSGKQNASQSEICFWDVKSGKRLKCLPGQSDKAPGSGALSPDGKHVATVDPESVRVLNSETGAPEQVISLNSTSTVRPAFSPDGNLVAVPIPSPGHSWIGLYEIKTGRRLYTEYRVPAGELTAVGWSPDGSRVVTGYEDGRLLVWDAKSGAAIWQYLPQLPAGVLVTYDRCLFTSFTPDAKLLVVAGYEKGTNPDQIGIVKIYQASDGTLVRKFTQDEFHRAALSADGKVLVLATASINGSTHLQAIDLESGKVLYVNPPKSERFALRPMSAMQFLENKRLQGACGEGDVIIFDGMTGEEERRFVADWRVGAMREDKNRPPYLGPAAFSADGRLLISFAMDRIHLWNVESGEMELRMQHPPRNGGSISLSPDAKTFATSGSQDTKGITRYTIRVYDVRSGKALLKAHPEFNIPGVLAFSPDGTKLLSGYSRGVAMIWDVRK